MSLLTRTKVHLSSMNVPYKTIVTDQLHVVDCGDIRTSIPGVLRQADLSVTPLKSHDLRR